MTHALTSADGTGLTLGLSMLTAYALGCLNSGYVLVCWKTGQDLRRLGSGNAGAANVERVENPELRRTV